MCDLPEEELAEYLLWLEQAEARARTAARPGRAPARWDRESPPEPLLADA